MAVLEELISIHAPARGASSSLYQEYRIVQFQFTPLREGLRNIPQKRFCHGLFQFTPLREGLPRSRMGQTYVGYFNSRPCERGFQAFCCLLFSGCSFQFTPLREGLQVSPRLIIFEISISIHAPARGASCFHFTEYGGFIIFQFTPLREGLLG